MKRLVKFELHKLFRSKAFYICFGALVFSLLLSVILQWVMQEKMEDFAALLGSYTAEQMMLSFVPNANFSMICGIFVAVFVCYDFDAHIVKDIYARGYSRLMLFVSKALTVFIAASIMFAVISLLNAFLSYGLFDKGSDIFGEYYTAVKYMPLRLLCLYGCTLAYTSFAICFAFVLRKIGGTIPIVILASSFIGLGLQLIDLLFDEKDFLLSDFWLDGFITSAASASTDLKHLLLAFGLSIAYTAMFLIPGYLAYRKKDV